MTSIRTPSALLLMKFPILDTPHREVLRVKASVRCSHRRLDVKTRWQRCILDTEPDPQAEGPISIQPLSTRSEEERCPSRKGRRTNVGVGDEEPGRSGCCVLVYPSGQRDSDLAFIEVERERTGLQEVGPLIFGCNPKMHSVQTVTLRSHSRQCWLREAGSTHHRRPGGTESLCLAYDPVYELAADLRGAMLDLDHAYEGPLVGVVRHCYINLTNRSRRNFRPMRIPFDLDVLVPVCEFLLDRVRDEFQDPSLHDPRGLPRRHGSLRCQPGGKHDSPGPCNGTDERDLEEAVFVPGDLAGGYELTSQHGQRVSLLQRGSKRFWLPVP